MITHTLIGDFQKLFTANVTSSSFSPLVPTGNEPSIGNGVLDMAGEALSDRAGASLAQFAFYGQDSADQTFTARITGWRAFTTDVGTLWIPTPLLALTLTMGAAGGDGDVLDTVDFFVDTIVADSEFTEAKEIISPADDTVALVKVDAAGCKYVQVQLATGSCSQCNVLGARL